MTDPTPGGWPDAARPGYPKDPERDGWHWLLDGNHEPYLLQWSGDNQRWGDYPGTSAADLAEFGIGYLAPCHTPAEVAALVEAARREEREAIACDLDCGCPDETKAAVLEALRGGFNSAKRWKACSHSECSAIEAAAIRARGDA